MNPFKLLQSAVFPRQTQSVAQLSGKESWELDWQCEWASEVSHAKTRTKILEYWKTFRHLDEFVSIANITPATQILDVGCGISTVLHFLDGTKIGIDPLADEYREIYTYPNDIEIVNAPGESIPFDAGRFDVVTCSNCIDHTSTPATVLSEIQRVLRKGGHLLLTCEVFSQDIGVRNEAHPHSLTIEQLRQLVGRFAIIKEWTSPWYGLKRYCEGKRPTPQTEHILLLQNLTLPQ